MKQGFWTVTVLQVRGIPIRIHLTLLLFLGLIVLQEAHSLHDALQEFLFVAGIFGCIALHELGHALTAARFQIQTRDIVLYPFGGIASIAANPAPKAELIIALAGPLVNVVIVALIAPFIAFEDVFVQPTLAGRLCIANAFLAVFNMIPALPMDGGRVFRALLALGGMRSATLIASRTSQIISVLLAVLAFYWGRVDLMLIAAVVFAGAAQEQFQEHARTAVQGRTVRDAMIEASRLETFVHGMTLSQSLLAGLKSLQEYFPIAYGGNVLGVISKEALLQAASQGMGEAYITEISDRTFPTVSPDDDLSAVLERPEGQSCDYFVVLEKGTFVGMLLKEKVIEFLLVDDLRRRIARAEPSDDLPPF